MQINEKKVREKGPLGRYITFHSNKQQLKNGSFSDYFFGPPQPIFEHLRMDIAPWCYQWDGIGWDGSPRGVRYRALIIITIITTCIIFHASKEHMKLFDHSFIHCQGIICFPQKKA